MCNNKFNKKIISIAYSASIYQQIVLDTIMKPLRTGRPYHTIRLTQKKDVTF